MSCREVIDILYDTWKYFRMKSFKRHHGHIYHEFNLVVPVEHHVRVCEQTWGKQGWHHHFHCIFWIKRGLEQEAVRWEERLRDFWDKVCRGRILKYWQKHKLHQNILAIDGTFDKILDRLFSKTDVHCGVYFSKNPDGSLMEADSAEYVSGWGADTEVTGNYKKSASHAGHFTPYQILLKAQTDESFAKLYIDFCLAMTTKPVHHRVDFSQSGITKLVDSWQKEHGRKSATLQKKRTEQMQTPWRIVACFSKKDWYELCCLDRFSPVISNIMYLAANYVYLLGDYLQSLGIEPLGYTREYDEIEALYNRAS